MAKQSKPTEAKEPGPLLKAFSIERKEGNWVMVEIHYRDEEIVEVIRSQPDLKMVAIERFKIQSFKYWSTIG